MRSLYITGSARVAVLSVSVLLLLSTLPNTWLFANSESGNSQSTTHLEHWSDEELKSLQSLHIENLRPVPASPGSVEPELSHVPPAIIRIKIFPTGLRKVRLLVKPNAEQ